jgi:Protein of unknown function (DUF1580)
MSTGILSETVLPIRDVPKRIGRVGRNGSYPHISWIMRGIHKGFNGHRLEALRYGSMWITSVEAVERWLRAQAEAAIQPECVGPPPADLRRQAHADARRHARAEREATALGI